jgi:hypothetical protein
LYLLLFLSRWWFIVIHIYWFRLYTIYLSTVSPSPLTAVAQSLSPETSRPHGSRKPGVSNRFVGIMRLKNLPRDKSTNMNIANEYEDRNSLVF